MVRKRTGLDDQLSSWVTDGNFNLAVSNFLAIRQEDFAYTFAYDMPVSLAVPVKKSRLISINESEAAPFLDRIDLQVVLIPLSNEERCSDLTSDESAAMRSRVEKSRERQRQRSISWNMLLPILRLHRCDFCRYSTPPPYCGRIAMPVPHLATEFLLEA